MLTLRRLDAVSIQSASLLLLNPSVASVNDISLGYIAAYVRDNGFSVEVIDLARDNPSPSYLRQITEELQPALIGIAAYQSSMDQVISIAGFLKTVADPPILLGGPQAFAMPDQGLQQLENIDILCRGEGEPTTLGLLEALAGEGELEGVPGISYQLPDGTVRTNPNPPLPLDLDEYPSPYLSGTLTPRARAAILTSRGCSHSCRFCITPALNQRTLRYHSIDRVMEELGYLQGEGVTSLWIADPLFLANRERSIALFRRMIESGLELNAWCETRFDLVDDELLDLMVRAGVSKVAYGLESADQPTLDLMGKQQDAARFTDVVRQTQRRGIEVELLHLFGCPGDTLDSVMRTFDLVRELDIPFRGNSTGQHHQLYFGSQDMEDPRTAGFVISRRYLPPDYPSYLSPGDNYRTRGLSWADLGEIRERKEAEKERSQLEYRVRMNEELFGIPPSATARMPWGSMKELRRAFRLGAADSVRAGARSIQQLFLLSLSAPTAKGIVAFRSCLDALSFDCTVTIAGGEHCLLLNDALLDPLVETLARSRLYDARLCFTFPPGFWAAQRSAVMGAIKRLEEEYVEPSGWPGLRRLCRPIALADLTDSPDASWREVQAIIDTLDGDGVDVYAFFRFFGTESVREYQERMARLLGPRGAAEAVMVGLADADAREHLINLYRPRRSPPHLPALQLIHSDPNALSCGGHFTPEDTPGPPAASCGLYLDGEGRSFADLQGLLATAESRSA
jgi:hypothetical protein